MSEDGYIYCFSNPSMPNILKIGMTKRTPEIRLSEANASNTWRPPTPYKIEFAKKVKNPKEKESTLHILLEQYTERINSCREFFRVSPEEVHIFFDLIDGETWIEKNKEEENENENENEEEENENEEEEKENKSTLKNKPDNIINKCREMSKCFKDGQRILHKIGINKNWIGIYDLKKNGILYENKLYTKIGQFTDAHYKKEGNQRQSGWLTSKCETDDGKWISTNNLPALFY